MLTGDIELPVPVDELTTRWPGARRGGWRTGERLAAPCPEIKRGGVAARARTPQWRLSSEKSRKIYGPWVATDVWQARVASVGLPVLPRARGQTRSWPGLSEIRRPRGGRGPAQRPDAFREAGMTVPGPGFDLQTPHYPYHWPQPPPPSTSSKVRCDDRGLPHVVFTSLGCVCEGARKLHHLSRPELRHHHRLHGRHGASAGIIQTGCVDSRHRREPASTRGRDARAPALGLKDSGAGRGNPFAPLGLTHKSGRGNPCRVGLKDSNSVQGNPCVSQAKLWPRYPCVGRKTQTLAGAKWNWSRMRITFSWTRRAGPGSGYLGRSRLWRSACALGSECASAWVFASAWAGSVGLQCASACTIRTVIARLKTHNPILIVSSGARRLGLRFW